MLRAKHGDRVLAARWEMGGQLQFQADIEIKGIDKLGLLHQITQVISQLHNLNIRRLEIEVKDGVFEGMISFYVHSTAEVKEIIDTLKKIPDVQVVARV